MSSHDASSSGPPPVSLPPRESNRPAWTGHAPIFNWILLLSLSMLAGVAAWLVGERTMVYAKLSRAAAENYRDSTALNAEMPGVRATNGALSFGALGGLLGLTLGGAGGL